jgi:hypothetical protein
MYTLNLKMIAPRFSKQEKTGPQIEKNGKILTCRIFLYITNKRIARFLGGGREGV